MHLGVHLSPSLCISYHDVRPTCPYSRESCLPVLGHLSLEILTTEPQMQFLSLQLHNPGKKPKPGHIQTAKAAARLSDIKSP